MSRLSRNSTNQLCHSLCRRTWLVNSNHWKHHQLVQHAGYTKGLDYRQSCSGNKDFFRAYCQSSQSSQGVYKIVYGCADIRKRVNNITPCTRRKPLQLLILYSRIITCLPSFFPSATHLRNLIPLEDPLTEPSAAVRTILES